MKKWFLISGYLIVVTLFFLYYLFPSQAIISYVNSRFSEAMPGFHITIAQIKPGFPPCLKLSAPVLYRQDKELIGAELIKIKPRYTKLFSPLKSFAFSGSLYNGYIDGSADIEASQSTVTVSLLLDNIAVGKIPLLTQVIPHTLNGNASGRIEYNNKPPFGAGKAEIAMSGCQIEFKPSLFGMEQLKLDIVDAGIEMDNNQVKITKFEAKGSDLSGKVSGSVSLRNPFEQSNMNISGRVTPKPTLLKDLAGILPLESIGQKNIGSEGIPFQISGTFENPSFSMK